MDTLVPSGVTDSSCLRLHFIYTRYCLTLITLGDAAAGVATEERGEVFNCDSSGGQSSAEALRSSCRTGRLGADDRSRVMGV